MNVRVRSKFNLLIFFFVFFFNLPSFSITKSNFYFLLLSLKRVSRLSLLIIYFQINENSLNMFWTEYVLGFAVFLFVLYKYGTRNRNFWKKRGVKQTDPLVPFLGDSYPAFFKMMDPIQMTLHVYNFFKEERYAYRRSGSIFTKKYF